MPVRWKPDHDAPDSIDDFTATEVRTVRFERMSNSTYWFAVELHDGTWHHFDFYLVPKRRRINVFPRQEQSKPQSAPLSDEKKENARLRGLHTCTMSMSSMNCRACNRGVPYPHMTIEEIKSALEAGAKERKAAERTQKRSPRR